MTLKPFYLHSLSTPKDYLTGRKLDEVECVIADLPGIARGKAVPAAKYARQGSFHLPDSIFYQTITGDWGGRRCGRVY